MSAVRCALRLTLPDQPDRRIITAWTLNCSSSRTAPNEAPTAAVLRTALDDVGLARISIVTTTREEAERRGFVGSPTILIDGIDPFAEPRQSAALACRIYRNTAGPGGVPDLRQLRQTLKRVAAANLAAGGVV